MSAVDVPLLGTLVLALILLSASYTFAMGAGAGRGRPHLLSAARWGTYATAGLVVVAVCLLAFAFQTHDFRIRYVAQYSDRSMPWWYLVASLWGGQDGSILWWTFLLAGWSSAAVWWMRDRFAALAPWVIATLMSIIVFFVLTMLFAANPFSTYLAGAPPEGTGLNPLLQNYWMIIHPPSLYMGFVGWSVPFAFAVAALISGRLHTEWIYATRSWMIAAWLFLSIGLTLGMLWSYEELGWGGYWAWDPVENASFMPWLVGTAFLHSVMIQERYSMLKVWNVFLICFTFIMTIFGTFLTRSGLIASVHSFARSDIGVWFAWYMGFLVLGCVLLVAVRWKALKAEHRIEALVSREFAFLFNNWLFLFMMIVVLGLTTAPLLSEVFTGEVLTVGPSVYNAIMPLLGIPLLFLMGVGPLIAWRRATGKHLRRAFTVPLIAGGVVFGLHIVFGSMLGFPAMVDVAPVWDDRRGELLAAFGGIAPLLIMTCSGFVVATVVQEFVRGTRARMRKGEGAGVALVRLLGRARRRYGGYIVHVGIVLMFIGFAGSAYDVEQEDTLAVGKSMVIERSNDPSGLGRHTVRYEDFRVETDRTKQMAFTDMKVKAPSGRWVGTLSPAKFTYRVHPENPTTTTEVAIRSRPLQDLYVIMNSVNPETERGTFRIMLRPLVMWIWLGGVLLVFGTVIALLPSARQLLGPERGRSSTGKGKGKGMPKGAAAGALLLAGVLLGGPVVQAQDDTSSSLHAGTVVMKSKEERRLFGRLLCMCGDCARLPLDTCGCSWAEDARAQLRARLENGAEVGALVAEYRDEHGSGSVAVPADEGLFRVMWLLPTVVGFLAVGVVGWLGYRWRGQARERAQEEAAREPAPDGSDAEYDTALDEELAQMEAP